ncbi:hypothetical protein [Algoriphagus litoralis]|uniref:hypothetical protein n=1 Tax=Algoriphagus litoralis TaxID=2202829 RepID=UPI001300AAF3|nr:hypothetical protein [Algoriphagus litoralis]
MISQVRIYPPQNWQDFEHLTLRLWGEIWRVQDEIEFNAEVGSSQKGVDIYCIPKNEKRYFGIQCKNKKLFCKYGKHNKLSVDTIDQEIEKAKSFRPKLEKLIIATSFGKDSKLEEYVRELNLLHIRNGEFKIQICFWDYFSRKISEYENIYNWYLKNQNFQKTKTAFVSFENNETELSYSPEYIKCHVTYRLQTDDEKLEEKLAIQKAFENFDKENRFGFIVRLLTFFKNKSDNILTNNKVLINGIDIRSEQYIESTYPRKKHEINHFSILPNNSFKDKQEYSIKLKIENVGQSVIEDFKLEFNFEGDYEEIRVISPKISEINNYNASTWINDKFGLFEPDKNFIVQKDFVVSKNIIVTPKLAVEGIIVIKWRLLARDYNDDGELRININPKFIETQKTMYVLKTSDCKTETEFGHKMLEGRYYLNL